MLENNQKIITHAIDEVIKKYERPQLEIFEKIITDFLSVKWLSLSLLLYVTLRRNSVINIFEEYGILGGLLGNIWYFCFHTLLIFIFYSIAFGVPKSYMAYRNLIFEDDDKKEK